MVCKYRIVLSVDGAGIKGVIPLKILSYLHDSILKIDDEIDCTAWIDVFASTSASSIFTGALMLKDENGRTKYTPNNILDFYVKRGTQIFSQNIGLDAENSVYPLSFTLDYFFGEVNTMDLKNHFLFLSYNQSKQAIFPFSNTMERYQSLSLSKVMTACSAIPGIYPSFNFAQQEICDALEHIQNPSQYAYDYARLFYPDEHIILISIGAGEELNPSSVCLQSKEVHEKLLKIEDSSHQFNYFRFQPKLKSIYDASNVTNEMIESLLDVAEEYMDENEDAFQNLLELIAFKTA